MPKPNRTKFDWVGFGKLVLEHRTALELNLRDCSAILGIAHPTIYRIEQGKPCTVVHYLFLCEWMKIDPYKFTKEHPGKN